MGGADLILVINVGFCVLMFLHKYSRNSFRILFLLLLLINMDYLYWNKHQLIGMLIDVGLNKLVSSYNLKLLILQNNLKAWWCRFLVEKRFLFMPMVHLFHQRALSLDPLSPYHLDYLYQIDAISQFTSVPYHELLLQSLS